MPRFRKKPVLLTLALLAACRMPALNEPRPEPVIRLELAEKKVDTSGDLWDHYRVLGEPRGEGYILIAKNGYACSVSRREWIMADEGLWYPCRWKKPRVANG